MDISSEDAEIPVPINTIYGSHGNREDNHSTAPKIRYRECQKNHAASMGGNATDGCGEFMPGAGEEGTLQFLTCSVCNCHRNFHRRENIDQVPYPGQFEDKKKRVRTKFSQEQKERMLEFAEKIGWKIQRQEDDVIEKFCKEVGIKRSVFKVWMNNNKYNIAKRSHIHHPNKQQQLPKSHVL